MDNKTTDVQEKPPCTYTYPIAGSVELPIRVWESDYEWMRTVIVKGWEMRNAQKEYDASGNDYQHKVKLEHEFDAMLRGMVDGANK